MKVSVVAVFGMAVDEERGTRKTSGERRAVSCRRVAVGRRIRCRARVGASKSESKFSESDVGAVPSSDCGVVAMAGQARETEMGRERNRHQRYDERVLELDGERSSRRRQRGVD